MFEKSFKRYKSLLKTKLIKDKRNGKNKGYGFVSIGNPDDYLRAFREMNGALIGGRPVRVKKSDWKKRSTN